MRWLSITACFGLFAAAADAAGVTAIVKTGDPAPGGPPGAIFASASANFGVVTPALDDLGAMLFFGQLATGSGGVTAANDTGLWAPAAFGLIHLVAREGDPVPGAPEGWVFSDFQASFAYSGHTLASGGRAVFATRIENPSLGTTGAGLFQTGVVGLRLVAMSGDAAPDTPAGARFSGFSRPVQNATGRIAVRAGLTAEPGVVDETNNAGIWVTDAGGSLRLVLRQGDLGPGLIADHVRFLADPRINAAGELLLGAALEERVDQANDALWKVAANGAIQLIAYSGGPAPGYDPGTLFGAIGTTSADFSAAGEIIFEARFAIGPGGVTSDVDSGLFVTDAAGTAYILFREGDPAPGAPPGAVFGDALGLLPRINARGDVAFLGRLAVGPGGITFARSEGIWGPGLGEPITMLSQRGDPAPGIPGRWLGTAISSGVALTDRGEVFWQPALQTSPTGSGVARNALLVASGGRPPTLLASNQTPFEVAPGDFRTISGELFPIATGSSGGGAPRGVHETGTVALRAAFLDGTAGIFRIELPPACADGLDNDGDGATDHPADAGCRDATAIAWESPACDDGRDNDGDGTIDHPADPGCATAHDADERPRAGCGLGAELAITLTAFRAARSRRSAMRRPRDPRA